MAGRTTPGFFAFFASMVVLVVMPPATSMALPKVISGNATAWESQAGKALNQQQPLVINTEYYPLQAPRFELSDSKNIEGLREDRLQPAGPDGNATSWRPEDWIPGNSNLPNLSRVEDEVSSKLDDIKKALNASSE
mmetsp:Transcript_50915/g.110449  ORF Transcript_50915/g.110449 Transcript_50915/m.110449 type:complete len:136 (+) Transcript_50915:63-470(+)